MHYERWEAQASYHGEIKKNPTPQTLPRIATTSSWHQSIIHWQPLNPHCWHGRHRWERRHDATPQELRMSEQRAAAYEVEGGNLERSVVLAQRGSHCRVQQADDWRQNSSILTPGSVTGGSDWSLGQRRGSNDSKKHQCVSSVGASWTLFWETLT